MLIVDEPDRMNLTVLRSFTLSRDLPRAWTVRDIIVSTLSSQLFEHDVLGILNPHSSYLFSFHNREETYCELGACRVRAA